MRERLAAALAGAAVGLLAAPGASAATLDVDRACYGPTERIVVHGTGFTPSGDVALSVSGRQLGVGTADRDGVFPARLRAPAIDGRRERQLMTATDQEDLSVSADASFLLSSLAVGVRPRQGRPDAPRRVRARGFTRGRALFAHVRRGRRFRRDLRVGRLRGPCGRVVARRRFLPRDARPGVYRVQFDARRRYSRRTTPSVSFLVAVSRGARGAAAAAATATAAARWTRLD